MIDRTAQKTMAGNGRYCVCRRPAQTLSLGDRHRFSTPRAAVLRGARWGDGDGRRTVVTVGFLGGDTSLRARVKQFAQEWMGWANVVLDFRVAGDTDVRVAFRSGNGSWSLLGTECQDAPPGEATVNFGWLEPSSEDDDVRSVVLHEFGHVLGLVHEHQSPAGGGIKWDRDAVISELEGPPNAWTQEEIEQNVLSEWDRTAVTATPLDPQSIMMYPIPASWTLDGFSADFNRTLSEQDKLLVQSAYPA